MILYCCVFTGTSLAVFNTANISAFPVFQDRLQAPCSFIVSPGKLLWFGSPTVIHFLYPLIRFKLARSEAYPGCHWARHRVHPWQVTRPSQMQMRQTTIYTPTAALTVARWLPSNIVSIVTACCYATRTVLKSMLIWWTCLPFLEGVSRVSSW